MEQAEQEQRVAQGEPERLEKPDQPEALAVLVLQALMEVQVEPVEQEQRVAQEELEQSVRLVRPEVLVVQERQVALGRHG